MTRGVGLGGCDGTIAAAPTGLRICLDCLLSTDVTELTPKHCRQFTAPRWDAGEGFILQISLSGLHLLDCEDRKSL